MKTELDEILDFYKNEKLALENQIEQLVSEREFKQAHIHQKALKKVNQSLTLFENLKNPNQIKINELELQLAHLKNIQTISYSSDFFERIIQPIEQKLKELKVVTDPNRLDGQEFDDMIFDLIADKLHHFQFFLNKKSDLYLEFKKIGQAIFITIPKYKKLKKAYILSKSSRKKLKNIGFKLTHNKKNLVFEYDITSFKDANGIKTIVSRVIYDGFGIYHLQNSTIIRIIG